MPSTTQTQPPRPGPAEPQSERFGLPAHRGLDGRTEDERREQPLVLAPGMVLVAFDGGPAGRAALRFALRHTTGPLAVAHVWRQLDPVGVLRVARHPRDTAALLRDLGRCEERAREDAARVAGAGVALAQEAGRPATPVLVAAPHDGAPSDALVAWAERAAAGQLVMGMRPAPRWRRLLGADPAQRLVAAAACPVTVVRVDDR